MNVNTTLLCCLVCMWLWVWLWRRHRGHTRHSYTAPLMCLHRGQVEHRLRWMSRSIHIVARRLKGSTHRAAAVRAAVIHNVDVPAAVSGGDALKEPGQLCDLGDEEVLTVGVVHLCLEAVGLPIHRKHRLHTRTRTQTRGRGSGQDRQQHVKASSMGLQ